LDAAQSHVAAVILDEIRSLPREQFGLPVPRDRRLLRITSALATDLSDTRRLEEWAKWAGLSPRTLSRRFLAETGFTFSGWRQRARLMKAVDLIAAGASVTAIAMDLGYGNVSAFIAMFKREFATTPSAFAEDVVRRHAT
jgi:AraC-like DNA-binding protein